MNELQIFNNPEFGKIRGLEIDGEPWAVGKDVAAALGYDNPTKVVRDHVDSEDKMGAQNGPPLTDSMGRVQYPTWINESGIYSLIFSSKLPSAKRFKRWVTSEVLPALRKTGRYEVPQEAQGEATLRELTPGDYIRAASIIATCQKGRLQSVITMLERSELDMSGIREATVPRACPETYNELESILADRTGKIVDFVSRQVPSDWPRWDLNRRRRYWAGEYDGEDIDLVDGDRISAIEVWCELFGGSPQDRRKDIRFINSVLSNIPGWRPRTVRAGVSYGPGKGFIQPIKFIY